MSKLFKVFGIIYIITNIVVFFMTLKEFSLFGFINIFSNIILGLALFIIGELIERISILEGQLDSKKENQEESQIQQITCQNCKHTYDIDYPKCPNCGYKNDLFN